MVISWPHATHYLYHVFGVKPGMGVYIAVGGVNIRIVHCFDHDYVEDIKIIFFISLKTTKIISQIQISEVCDL
jgi:hypothetical protein